MNGLFLASTTALHWRKAPRYLCLPGIPTNPFALEKGGIPGQISLLSILLWIERTVAGY